ncbi:MAG: hypothetical protein ACJAWI_002689 [Marinomonas primoryensis]|jgi:hypothetical protein
MVADNVKDFDEVLDSKIKAAEFLTMRSMGTRLRSTILGCFALYPKIAPLRLVP